MGRGKGGIVQNGALEGGESLASVAKISPQLPSCTLHFLDSHTFFIRNDFSLLDVI